MIQSVKLVNKVETDGPENLNVSNKNIIELFSVPVTDSTSLMACTFTEPPVPKDIAFDYQVSYPKNATDYVITMISNAAIEIDLMKEVLKTFGVKGVYLRHAKRLCSSNGCAKVLELLVSCARDEIPAQELRLLEIKYSTTNIAIQLDSPFRKHKRLAVFDMDSTLIQQEVIDELAREAGVMEQVKSITHRAMNGELDFKASLKERVALLAGSPVSIIDTVRQRLSFTPGAKELCKGLRKLGCKMAVISGGFIPLAKVVQEELGLDYAFANNLAVSTDGAELVGETYGPVVDGVRKAELLVTLSQLNNISREQVLSVGDGANDLLMLAEAGTGIAFNAKPKVQEKAAIRLNKPSLVDVFYLMGFTEEEIRELIN
ncbi:hypothetical protein MP638_002253 [Amoeboaphelidium occidentale]|nr:hypothetical protein MP638_002253 [Amoeboaphelidium occidentale]